MATELEKTLNKMKVTIKVTEQPCSPARGFSPDARSWRVTLTKEIKGEEKPLKMTLVMLAKAEPTLDAVIDCINTDIDDSELTEWEFAQQYSPRGKADMATESMYRACKRFAARAKRFFGDSKLARSVLRAA